MWDAWDMAAEICLSQLPQLVLDPSTEFQPSPFFTEQLTAFEVWLDHGSEHKKPPEQLPIVLQVPRFLYLFSLLLRERGRERFIFICHFLTLGFVWIWLRNILWLPSGRSIIILFAYCHFSVFIESGLFQVLLSQCHRFRALVLLGRFLDMGSWAVDLALSVGIFPYVLKLLQTTTNELRQILVFIWTKILALDKVNI
jgi:regulator-associated protein of mTOR